MKNTIVELTVDGQTKKIKTPKTLKQSQKEAAMIASIYPLKFQNTSILSAAGYEVKGTQSSERSRAADAVPAPINNMGVKSNDLDDGTERITIRPKGKNGHSEIIRIPKPETNVDKRVGFVDQVSFTVRVSEVIGREMAPFFSPVKAAFAVADAVPRLSTILMYIFGFAVTHERERGVNFYKQSFTLGEGEGILNAGGQNDTINVQIYGQGIHKARDEWENRLKYYLSTVGGWITRIDLAADFFDGSYGVEDAERDYLNGLMTGNGRTPFAERRGDWYTGQGGRTFYVGRRHSGKLLRVYEKGLQILGSIAAKQIDEANKLAGLLKWVRIECEWHNTNRICPLDMLTNPGQYLAGSYPAYKKLSAIQNIVETTVKAAQMTVERSKQFLKNQAGRHLYTQIQLFGEEVIHEFLRPKFVKFVTAFGSLLPEDDAQNLLVNETTDEQLLFIGAIPF